MEEIAESFQVDKDVFFSQAFIDKNKMMIKGNKKIPLYIKSPLFNKHLENFLTNVFVENQKKKRSEKIQTIVENVNKKFFSA